MRDLHALRAAEAIQRALHLERDTVDAEPRLDDAIAASLPLYMRCRDVETLSAEYIKAQRRLDRAVKMLNSRIGRMKREH